MRSCYEYNMYSSKISIEQALVSNNKLIDRESIIVYDLGDAKHYRVRVSMSGTRALRPESGNSRGQGVLRVCPSTRAS